jgi:hypothetical protein
MTMRKSNTKQMDFTKIDWESITYPKLQFFFKEAVDYNDSLLEDINRLSQKGFHLLTLALTVISLVTGWLLSSLENGAEQRIISSLTIACMGFGLVTILLFVSIFPRTIYRGRATPHIFFSSNLYKCLMPKILADGIASYHRYITSNYKVLQFRSSFLTAALLVLIGVAPVTILVYQCFLLN